MNALAAGTRQGSSRQGNHQDDAGGERLGRSSRRRKQSPARRRQSPSPLSSQLILGDGDVRPAATGSRRRRERRPARRKPTRLTLDAEADRMRTRQRKVSLTDSMLSSEQTVAGPATRTIPDASLVRAAASPAGATGGGGRPSLRSYVWRVMGVRALATAGDAGTRRRSRPSDRSAASQATMPPTDPAEPAAAPAGGGRPRRKKHDEPERSRHRRKLTSQRTSRQLQPRRSLLRAESQQRLLQLIDARKSAMTAAEIEDALGADGGRSREPKHRGLARRRSKHPHAHGHHHHHGKHRHKEKKDFVKENKRALQRAERAKKLERLYRAIDTDGSGEIDFEELAAVCNAAPGSPEEADVRALFALLDSDGSGAVNSQELEAGLKSNKAARQLAARFEALHAFVALCKAKRNKRKDKGHRHRRRHRHHERGVEDREHEDELSGGRSGADAMLRSGEGGGDKAATQAAESRRGGSRRRRASALGSGRAGLVLAVVTLALLLVSRAAAATDGHERLRVERSDDVQQRDALVEAAVDRQSGEEAAAARPGERSGVGSLADG